MKARPPSVRQICTLPRDFKNGSTSLQDLCDSIHVSYTSAMAVLAMIFEELSADPGLVDDWQTYSYDKRTGRGPYLDRLTVGFYDGGESDIRSYPSLLEACSDFVMREWIWLKTHQRWSPDP